MFVCDRCRYGTVSPVIRYVLAANRICTVGSNSRWKQVPTYTEVSWKFRIVEDRIRELRGKKSATYWRRLYKCVPGFPMPVLSLRSLNKELPLYLHVYYCELLQYGCYQYLVVWNLLGLMVFRIHIALASLDLDLHRGCWSGSGSSRKLTKFIKKHEPYLCTPTNVGAVLRWYVL
jgi:hypothetical protein